MLVLCLSMSQSLFAVDIALFGPGQAANTSASIGTVTAYTTNLGVAFLTGGSGPFKMDWVTLDLTSSAISTPGTFKLAIHDSTSTTPYVGVAGTTAYATDTVSYTTPATANTPFLLTLRAADIPNVSGYSMLANTAYTLFVYNASGSLALRRTTGLADGTTNAFYTVSNGFTALDTFRNNTANYTNSPGSFVGLQIAFGQTVVPEPSTWALGGMATIFCVALRKRSKVARA
jgi:hypothetical protein